MKLHSILSGWKALLLLPFLLLALNSCDLESEPEEPDYEGQIKNMLPQVQRNIAFWHNQDFNRFQAIWMQQLAGVRGIPQSADRYDPSPEHLDDSWNYFYNNIYFRLQDLIFYSQEAEATGFLGISKILKAYSFLVLTDSWGDIPFSQAPNYMVSGIWPEYDDQEFVLDQILSLLDSGIEHLQNANPNAAFTPDPQTDHFYSGHLSQWIRAGNLFRLRLMLRMANQQQDYSAIAQEISSLDLFSSGGEDMYYPFDGSSQNQNPFYAYEHNVRNTRMGKFFVDMLKENDDPRLTKIVRINTSNEYVGSAPGQSLHTASFIGPSLASAASPMVIASFAEVQFIKAEVYYRSGQQAMADLAFEQAVKASLEFHQAEDPEWEAEYAEVEDVTLEQIIRQKYIALFLQPEVWSDYRRTGYPQITPYEPEEYEIPRRQIYPQAELNNNAENVPQDITIFDRVWWDIENR